MFLRILLVNSKEFVFITNNLKFVELVKENLNKIIFETENEFGKVVPNKIYIIIDDFGISRAVLLKDIGVILLNNEGGKRNIKKLLFYFIHELCHLTKKGNFPFGKTPKEVHERFNYFAERLLKEIKINNDGQDI